MRLERTDSGLVIHSPLEYDLRFWLRSRGRERRFRETLVDLARLELGESVLDVGCATGSTALAAKRRVGSSGRVCAVEPSAAMVAAARRKARRARLDVRFDQGAAQALPYDDGTFDAVTCTLVLHQLPHDAWRQSLLEMRRVLTTAGRLLLVDIRTSADHASTPHSHGHFDLDRLVPSSRTSACGWWDAARSTSCSGGSTASVMSSPPPEPHDSHGQGTATGTRTA